MVFDGRRKAPVFLVRPAGRTYLKVQGLYSTDKGKSWQSVEKRFPDTKVPLIVSFSQREAFFNSPGLGNLRGGVAPFCYTL